MKKCLTLLLLLFAALTFPALGEYMAVETRDIPLQRLIANLTGKARLEPSNANVLHLLARTHAIAYSRKLAESDPVKSWSGWRKDQPEQPWFGYEPPHVPFSKVTEAKEEEKRSAATAHLKKAIETYRKAIAAKPDDNTMKLGLAWCLDQAGEKKAAIEGYRAVAAAAWEKENREFGGLGNFLYVETAGYLIPLLDPVKDAAAIADMEAKKKKLLSLPRAITPLVIPVGEAIELSQLIDPEARVRFDLDGTGQLLEWQWITRDAAWLVFDPETKGRITSAIQMFGSRSFLLFCRDGYEALSLLDDDFDGTLRGKELEGLALWNDADSDGLSDPGEVKPLADHGIRSLSTKSRRHGSGMLYSPAGARFENGTTRPTYDLILQSKE